MSCPLAQVCASEAGNAETRDRDSFGVLMRSLRIPKNASATSASSPAIFPARAPRLYAELCWTGALDTTLGAWGLTAREMETVLAFVAGLAVVAGLAFVESFAVAAVFAFAMVAG